MLSKSQYICLVKAHCITAVSCARERRDLTYCDHIDTFTECHLSHFNNYKALKKGNSGYLVKKPLENYQNHKMDLNIPIPESKTVFM